jgi:hypothetical protein
MKECDNNKTRLSGKFHDDSASNNIPHVNRVYVIHPSQNICILDSRLFWEPWRQREHIESITSTYNIQGRVL